MFSSAPLSDCGGGVERGDVADLKFYVATAKPLPRSYLFSRGPVSNLDSIELQNMDTAWYDDVDVMKLLPFSLPLR